MTTIQWRKWECLTCNHKQVGTMSYYKWRKLWNEQHFCVNRTVTESTFRTV